MSAQLHVLLDTHTLLWYADDAPQLPRRLKQLLDDERTTCYVSVISFWEVATLVSLNRLTLVPDL